MNVATESTVRTLVANEQDILATDEILGTGTPLPHVFASRRAASARIVAPARLSARAVPRATAAASWLV
jgi:hypothetical protein